MSLEGPSNRPVAFAISCFIGMLLWQAIGKLESPLSSWWALWAPLIAVAAFSIARALTPRSQRLFDRARHLQEATDVGDWTKPRSQDDIAAARRHPWLQKAEQLYHESLAVQERLQNETEHPAEGEQHQRNIIVAHSQLALLLMMIGRLPEARDEAQEAVRLGRALTEGGGGEAKLTVLSEALFRLGQAEHLLGEPAAAATHLQEVITIDQALGHDESAHHARLLFDELTATPEPTT